MTALPNIDEIEHQIKEFSKGSVTDVSPLLYSTLEQVAKNGVPYYNWNEYKVLVAKVMEKVVDASNEVSSYVPIANEKFTDRKQRLLVSLESFEGAPFTIQRIAEVLIDPNRHYKNVNKLINCLDKLLCVSSIIPKADPRNITVEKPEVENDAQNVEVNGQTSTDFSGIPVDIVTRQVPLSPSSSTTTQ